MAEAIVLTAPQKMALMQMKGNAGRMSIEDRYSEFKQSGLPLEVIGALTDLSMKTAKTIAGEIIDIGKIIVMKILEFVKENPSLSIGIAIGGAVGALAVFIPFIGPFIAPLTVGLGVSIGAIIGNQMSDVNVVGIAKDLKNGTNYTSEEDFDKAEEKTKELFDSPVYTTIKNAIDIAKKFFKLLKEIILAIFNRKALA